MLQRCVRYDQDCDVEADCPGVEDPGACSRVRSLAAWRAKSRDEQVAYYVAVAKSIVPSDPGGQSEP